MARSLDIQRLTSEDLESRDQEWERAFFQALVENHINIEAGGQPQEGPDGWPYLFANTGPEASEQALKVLEWLSEQGVGLVINAHKEYPDYVFTYGMIWNFRETGNFLSELKKAHPGQVVFEKDQEVIAGPPSEAYLPPYVKAILKQFFKDQNIKDPRAMVMSTDGEHYDLVFSLDSLGHPPKEEHRGIAEAISWFLPGHYSIVLSKEKGLPPFHPLD